MVGSDDFDEAVEAARLAIAADDYDSLERASLQLVSLARRAKQEGPRTSGSDA